MTDRLIDMASAAVQNVQQQAAAAAAAQQDPARQAAMQQLVSVLSYMLDIVARR